MKTCGAIPPTAAAYSVQISPWLSVRLNTATAASEPVKALVLLLAPTCNGVSKASAALGSGVTAMPEPIGKELLPK